MALIDRLGDGGPGTSVSLAIPRLICTSIIAIILLLIQPDTFYDEVAELLLDGAWQLLIETFLLFLGV